MIYIQLQDVYCQIYNYYYDHICKYLLNKTKSLLVYYKDSYCILIIIKKLNFFYMVIPLVFYLLYKYSAAQHAFDDED